MIRSVGIKPGWRVLDAGCGGGSFLPLLAELVGKDGNVSALDPAPENIEAPVLLLNGEH
jgi:arsenite methyltransferase